MKFGTLRALLKNRIAEHEGLTIGPCFWCCTNQNRYVFVEFVWGRKPICCFIIFFLYFLKLTASNGDFSNLREVLCSYERKRFDKNDFGLQRNFYHVLFPLLSNKVGGDLEHERLYQRKGQLRFGVESKAHSTYIKTLIHFKIPCYL